MVLADLYCRYRERSMRQLAQFEAITAELSVRQKRCEMHRWIIKQFLPRGCLIRAASEVAAERPLFSPGVRDLWYGIHVHRACVEIHDARA
jgi:hypothetical protein